VAQAGSPGLAKHGLGALEARADSVSLLERGGSAFSVESDFLPEQRRSGLQARGFHLLFQLFLERNYLHEQRRLGLQERSIFSLFLLGRARGPCSAKRGARCAAPARAHAHQSGAFCCKSGRKSG